MTTSDGFAPITLNSFSLPRAAVDPPSASPGRRRQENRPTRTSTVTRASTVSGSIEHESQGRPARVIVLVETRMIPVFVKPMGRDFVQCDDSSWESRNQGRFQSEVTNEAATKGQSEQKCLIYGCGLGYPGYAYGNSFLGGRIYGGLGTNLLGGSWGNSIYGSAYLNGNPLLSLSGGLGLYLKDAPDAGKTHADNSVSMTSPFLTTYADGLDIVQRK
ncbi:hypothetical protein MJO28_010942 [Puccinia striiformis f. sp. tritici]|uniref:Uncharacterized protein n=1 Tax=Puccinia striiformis f. sp. tritici TaxID=168172 RepID=A0ACC0E6C2_9BASI|nr:hypothetical protein MJO28_010942 [Puccinia striiformis f. sp. tritici]